MTTAEAGYQFKQIPEVRRDLIARSPGLPQLSPGVNTYAQFNTSLNHVIADSPLPLRLTLGRPEFSMASSSYSVSRLNVDWNDPQTPITINAAPTLADHIKLTSGKMPAAFEKFETISTDGIDGPPLSPKDEIGTSPVIDILLSTESAKRAEWSLNEVRLVYFDSRHGFYARLSGTFDAKDPADGFWAVSSSALTPGISHTAFSGTNTLIVQSAAFIDPNSISIIENETSILFTTTVSIPFDGDLLTPEQYEHLLPQLRNFVSQPQSIASVAAVGTIPSLSFDSNAVTGLETALNRSATATSIFAMISSGSIGVCLVVLWLLARLIANRRIEMLTIARARGASPTQLVLGQSLGVLLLALIGGVTGGAISVILLVKFWHPSVLVGAILTILLVPAVFAISIARQQREVRTDLKANSSGFWRGLSELVVLALTALVMVLLSQRGLVSTSGKIQVDFLIASAPLLLALSAGIIALRVYPFLLVGLIKPARRGRKIVNFLGLSRIIREPAGGLAPVLALVVGISITVFTSVLLSTMRTGVDVAARAAIGAEMRLDSPPLSEEQITEIQSIDGIDLAVPVYLEASPHSLSVQDILSIPLLITNTKQLAEVQAGITGTVQISQDMANPKGSELPIILSPDLASRYEITKESTIDGMSVSNGGSAGYSTSLSSVEDWVLIDRTQAKLFGIESFRPKTTLIRLHQDADLEKVTRTLMKIAGPDSLISTPQDVEKATNSSPVSNALQFALLTLIGINGFLCTCVLVLNLLLLGPAREKLLALLRTLGLDRSQSRGILRWETWPSFIIAIFAGGALGIVLPWLVLLSVDLGPFTGGTVPPEIKIEPITLGLIGIGFSVLVLVSTTISLAIARSLNLARSLRTQ
ncbi:MAG: hypothetical protein KF867_04810 [Cryobacterium sp.]|nr:hypothetical protein [Cryobacterium sp.]